MLGTPSSPLDATSLFLPSLFLIFLTLGAARPTPASSETKSFARTAIKKAREQNLPCPSKKTPFVSHRGERERARSPLELRHPRGCRGAERPTPASSETKSFARTAIKKSKRRKPPLPIQKSPFVPHRGERERARSPLAPRHPRGCRGAARPTPASSETKSFARTAIKKKQEKKTSLAHPKISVRPPPRRAREGAQPSRTRPPRGCRGAEHPTPRVVGNNVHKRIARFVGNQNLHQNSPGRAREGVNPLDFQSRPATCAAERLLAQRASKSLRD